MKFVVCADLHLGTKRYGRIDKETDCDYGLLDTLQCLDAVIDFTLEKDIRLFIIAGDIYKNASPTALYHREFIKRINRLRQEGIEIVIVLGNHDIYYREGDYHAVSFLQELNLPGILVIDKPYTIVRGDERISFLLMPYQHKAKLQGQSVIECYKDAISKFAQNNEGAIKICIGHQLVADARIGSWVVSDTNDEILPLNLFDTFNFTILGHIHSRQALKENLVYCGSVDRLNFGEAKEDKGFVYYEDGNLKFMKIDVRRFSDFKFSIESFNDVEEMLKSLAGIKASDAVKISIEVDEQNLKLINTNEILDLGQKAFYTFMPCPLLSISRHKEVRSGIDEKTDIKDALREYVTQVIKAKDSEELIERGQQIIVEAERG